MKAKSKGRAAEKALRVAIYCRKSSDDKRTRDADGRESSWSVLDQEAACKALIERKGWSLVAAYKDDATTGRAWPDGNAYDAEANADVVTLQRIENQPRKRRPGLGAVLDMVSRGEVDAIVVRDMQRLARPVYPSGFCTFIARFFQLHNIPVYTLAEGRFFDLSNFWESFPMLLSDALMDQELQKRAKQSQEARQKRREEGRFTAHVPFGYIKRDKKLYRDPETAPIVEKFFLDTVKKIPISRQVREYNKRGKSKKGLMIRPQVVRQMLKNPLYYGDMLVNGKPIRCVDVASGEAIISKRVFLEVKSIFNAPERKRISSARAMGSGGVASGIVKCGTPHNPEKFYSMARRISSHGEKHNRYTCTFESSTGCCCSINAENLDEFISSFISVKNIVEHERNIANAKERDKLDGLRIERDELAKNISELTRDYLKGRLSGPMKQALRESNEEFDALERKITNIENIPEAMTGQFSPITGIGLMSREEKRESVRRVFREIRVSGDRVEFYFYNGELLIVKRIGTGRTGRRLPFVRDVPQAGGRMVFEIDQNALEFSRSKKYLDGKITIEPVDVEARKL